MTDQHVNRSRAISRVVPRHNINDDGPTTKVVVPHGKCAGKPTIDVTRDGNIIQSIQITCSCGEVIRLNCQYD